MFSIWVREKKAVKAQSLYDAMLHLIQNCGLMKLTSTLLQHSEPEIEIRTEKEDKWITLEHIISKVNLQYHTTKNANITYHNGTDQCSCWRSLLDFPLNSATHASSIWIKLCILSEKHNRNKLLVIGTQHTLWNQCDGYKSWQNRFALHVLLNVWMYLCVLVWKRYVSMLLMISFRCSCCTITSTYLAIVFPIHFDAFIQLMLFSLVFQYPVSSIHT